MKTHERDQLDALAWCRLHNVRVRFESDGTVTASGNFGWSRRRATFVEAVAALRERMENAQ